MQMLSEYASPEILSAMKELRAWQVERPKDFASAFKALLLKRDKSKEETELENRLDLARRRVSHFFNKLRVLCDINVMSERDIGATWGTGTYTFVADVLVPMESAKAEALYADGSISAQDKAQSDQIQRQNREFYYRVFHESRN
jgi:hypothetical protein